MNEKKYLEDKLTIINPNRELGVVGRNSQKGFVQTSNNEINLKPPASPNLSARSINSRSCKSNRSQKSSNIFRIQKQSHQGSPPRSRNDSLNKSQKGKFQFSQANESSPPKMGHTYLLEPNNGKSQAKSLRNSRDNSKNNQAINDDECDQISNKSSRNREYKNLPQKLANNPNSNTDVLMTKAQNIHTNMQDETSVATTRNKPPLSQSRQEYLTLNHIPETKEHEDLKRVNNTMNLIPEDRVRKTRADSGSKMKITSSSQKNRKNSPNDTQRKPSSISPNKEKRRHTYNGSDDNMDSDMYGFKEKSNRKTNENHHEIGRGVGASGSGPVKNFNDNENYGELGQLIIGIEENFGYLGKEVDYDKYVNNNADLGINSIFEKDDYKPISEKETNTTKGSYKGSYKRASTNLDKSNTNIYFNSTTADFRKNDSNSNKKRVSSRDKISNIVGNLNLKSQQGSYSAQNSINKVNSGNINSMPTGDTQIKTNFVISGQGLKKGSNIQYNRQLTSESNKEPPVGLYNQIQTTAPNLNSYSTQKLGGQSRIATIGNTINPSIQQPKNYRNLVSVKRPSTTNPAQVYLNDQTGQLNSINGGQSTNNGGVSMNSALSVMNKANIANKYKFSRNSTGGTSGNTVNKKPETSALSSTKLRAQGGTTLNMNPTNEDTNYGLKDRYSNIQAKLRELNKPSTGSSNKDNKKAQLKSNACDGYPYTDPNYTKDNDQYRHLEVKRRLGEEEINRRAILNYSADNDFKPQENGKNQKVKLSSLKTNGDVNTSDLGVNRNFIRQGSQTDNGSYAGKHSAKKQNSAKFHKNDPSKKNSITAKPNLPKPLNKHSNPFGVG